MNPTIRQSIGEAVRAMANGRVVACPTEAVYGLSCDPANRSAFDHLLELKQRPLDHGVLLIGSDWAHFKPLINTEALPAPRLQEIRSSWPGPETWVVPRSAAVPDWLAGKHAGIALRLTDHPVAAALCQAFGGALVSTSANRHGQPPACDAAGVRAQFADQLAIIIDGPLGKQKRPSRIRDALTGKVLRP